jgi:hypothetical protein
LCVERWPGQALPYSHIAETGFQFIFNELKDHWKHILEFGPPRRRVSPDEASRRVTPVRYTAILTTEEDTKNHGACTEALCRTMILRAFFVDLRVLRGEKRGPPIRFVAGEQARMGGKLA